MAKKNLFDESEEEVGDQELKINQEYARKFEHNKKREDRHRLEEKHKTQAANGDDSDDSESSSSEDEDENGFLATEELDAEISATLRAIKSKDPRIYDKDANFFPSMEKLAAAPKDKKEKPMFLHDYHRQRYMAGDTGADEDNAPAPRTFVQEQADLKKNIVAEINAAAEKDSDDDEDGFIKAKADPREVRTEDGIHPSRQEKIKPKALDVSLADKDPETFLSNFMESRAWIPDEASKARWEAFESDDDGGNDDADEWEAAFNLRFEDPTKSNEMLQSYSRKIVEARSVRREDAKGRKRQRELEKERKEEEKQRRREERSRLKRLKIEETEEKLRKIKKAAGLKGEDIQDDELMSLLKGSWDNEKWEEEMTRRFGEQYYAEREEGWPESSEDEAGSSKSRKDKKPQKPKWDDDIDIKDIIPEFEDEETKPDIVMSDPEAEADQPAEDNADDSSEDDRPAKKRKTTKDHKTERQTAKRAARQERSKIEALVDAQLELDDPTILHTSKTNKLKTPDAPAAGFRYRETSPQSFGLTPRDILLAPSDAALNEFAGLKKLATFRDADKKKKDKKHLGKKARLREWRREVFGREFEHTGPTFGFAGDGGAGGGGQADGNKTDAKVEARAGAAAGFSSEKKKKKRSKGKRKGGAD